MIALILKYTYTALTLGCCALWTYEDFRWNEVSTFPTLILIPIGFFFNMAILPANMPSTLLAWTVLIGLFAWLKPWGSGDTKMLAVNLLFWLMWFCPISAGPAFLGFAMYLFVLSILGLLTVFFMRRKKVPMGHCFLLTNVLIIVLAHYLA